MSEKVLITPAELSDLIKSESVVVIDHGGRVAVLNDGPAHGWMYDYRFLEALR